MLTRSNKKSKLRQTGITNFLNGKTITKYLVFIMFFLVLALLIAINSPKQNFIKTLASNFFSGNTPIKEVEITTEDYDNEGSIKLTKEAHWVSKTEAELDLKLETIRKTGDNKKDIVLVFDVSGSMEGDKLDKVKEDASELIEYVLDKDEDNKVGLITFASESRIISPLTNNKEELLETINSISTEDATNYYLAYKSIEEMLTNYNKETGKDLVVLFMTDGSPTENAGATKGVYDSLKEQHPYMTLNAVEYEKGKTASDTQDISDGQWIANMDTLNNVLFEATVSPEPYEKLSVIDYIDDEYFEIETNTPTKGSITVDNNKITWRFANNSYITGTEETLKIRLKLKEEYKDIKGLYQTNKKTEIEYKIDTEKETTSTLTPVLKNNYDVIYDINAPQGCNLEEIEGENHFIYDIVTIKNIEPKCTGYQLKGWQIEERDVKYKSEDKFIMPEEDVHIKAIWARQTMKAYMDGTVHEKTTLYKEIASQAEKYDYLKEYTGEHQDSLTVPGTENIYYYNGNVTTNNVIFAGFCWQILRTTDTGGIKLIYNGVPSNGTCNNTGVNSSIGNSAFNPWGDILSYVGYMYNKKYSTALTNSYANSNIINTVSINKLHYFSKYYDYNQRVANKYMLLDNPDSEENDLITAEDCVTNGNCNEILTGTYTHSSTNPEYASTGIKYIIGVSGETIFYLNLNNGQELSDVNKKLFIGSDYNEEPNGLYTISNDDDSPDIYTLEDWLNIYANIKKKYLCYGKNPCTNPLYLSSTTNKSYTYYSVANNYVYANDFDYVLNEETGEYEYVLKDTNYSNIVRFWNFESNYDKVYKNHYTCFNTTGRCKNAYFIHNYYVENIRYIGLSNGVSIEKAIEDMLYSDDVNNTNSTMKTAVENWYENNLLNYTNHIEDVIYCNDREIKNYGGWNPNGGSLQSHIQFKLNNTIRKNLKCTNITDSFMVNNEKAKLKYPIGILSSDDVGLSYSGDNRTSFIASNISLWTMSPQTQYINILNALPSNVYVNGDGSLRNHSDSRVSTAYGVRPVISLKPEIEYTDGDGSKNNPYIIDTSEVDNESSDNEP